MKEAANWGGITFGSGALDPASSTIRRRHPLPGPSSKGLHAPHLLGQLTYLFPRKPGFLDELFA
jgi:hypothetical protein